MATQRRHLKDTLEFGGYPRDTAIPAECDRQYNTSLRNCRRKTPFAPATQTRDIIAENLTEEKKIIGFNHESKLCKRGDSLRSRGIRVTCPRHEGCTATLSRTDHAGDEKNGGRKLAKILITGKEPIFVDKLTTDADGRMCEGFADEMMAASGVETEHFLDVVHLCRSVSTAISRAHFNPQLTVTCNYKQRQQVKNRLADSMAWRAEREIRAARSKFVKCDEIMVDAVSHIIPSIIKCYEGKHDLCKKHSLVCNGENMVYEYLPKFAHGNLTFSSQDTTLLETLLRKRMGREALLKTQFGLTTQKVESTNHAFATTNPKHSMTCAKNGIYRDHSAIHMLNNAVGDSIVKKAHACGVPLSPNSPCLKTLRQMSSRQAYWRHRSRYSTFRYRRACMRQERYNEYDILRNESFYAMGQLDPN